MRGVLCLHGFTGTPFEVRYLARHLQSRGFVVSTPTLPGHAADPSTLNRTTWSQWRDAVRDHVGALRGRCERVATVGLSLGGLLALDAAADGRLDAVASLSAPLWLEGPAGRVITALSRLPRSFTGGLPAVAKAGGSDVRDPEIRRTNPGYPVLPLSGVIELGRFMRRVRGRLEAVRCPLLVVHGSLDHTAPPPSAAEIVRRAASADKRLIMMPASYHLVSCDVERAEVAAHAGDFLERALA
jgi:carboxylesterase